MFDMAFQDIGTFRSESFGPPMPWEEGRINECLSQFMCEQHQLGMGWVPPGFVEGYGS
jgi:hypothetical protein